MLLILRWKFCNRKLPVYGIKQEIIQKRLEQQNCIKKVQQHDETVTAHIRRRRQKGIFLTLYSAHDCQKSRHVQAILNYHQIGYKRISDYTYLQTIKYRFQKIKQLKYAQRFPFLRVEIHLRQPDIYIGEQNILKFFINNHFLRNYRHQTHSAFAKEGVEFVSKQIQPPLQKLFWHPMVFKDNKLFIQAISFTQPQTYRRNTIDALPLRLIMYNQIIRSHLKRIVPGIFRNFIKSVRNKNQYKKARDDFTQSIQHWKIRMRGQNYHGGQQPDEADFALYSLLLTKWKSDQFNKFFLQKMPKDVVQWMVRMQRKCRYDKDRIQMQLL